jgi:hypothetical protein
VARTLWGFGVGVGVAGVEPRPGNLPEANATAGGLPHQTTTMPRDGSVTFGDLLGNLDPSGHPRQVRVRRPGCAATVV